jgi:hypothetical protein
MQMIFQPKWINIFVGYPKEALGILSTLSQRQSIVVAENGLFPRRMFS